MKANKIQYILMPILIVIAWFGAVNYTFNEKLDLNGDNCCYYIYASSLAAGEGYCDLSSPGNPPTSTFPPGYPILMAPLRMLTDSIIAQKWLNEIFVLAAILLLYFALLRLQMPMSISFTSAFACVFLPRLLHFSTMMMSESSFLLMTVISFYALIRLSEYEDSWKTCLRSPWLYVMIVAIVLTFHVRTQGIALIVGILLALLLRKRWLEAGMTIFGFILGYLPWALRNHALGLNNNRYLDSIMLSNPWQPEAGSLTFTEVVHRFFETLQMLIFNAIPSTIVPFVNVDPDHPSYSFSIYLIGAILILIMLVGCWQLGKARLGMILYIAATLGQIAIFSTPSGSRYITSVLPLLTIALFVGLWYLLTWLVQRKWASRTFPAYLLLLLLFLAKPAMAQEHAIATQRTPIQYKHFFAIGKELQKKGEKDIVVCSRKSQMLYIYGGCQGVNYLYTSDAEKLVQDLVDKKVDYVILDALGYSSTGLYLFPAIQKYAQFFPIVMHYETTHTYLLRFNREAAKTFFAQQ